MNTLLERLIAWITLIEMMVEPEDGTQLEEWLQEADDLTEGMELEEPAAQILTEQILNGYEETLRHRFESRSLATPLETHVRDLCTRPQLEQRTTAWYKQMGTLISASELGSLFGSVKQRAQLILSKVNPVTRPPQPLALESVHMSAFDWGIRFEPVVKQIYNYKYQTTIQELGRLLHPTDPRCSASPDGMIVSQERYGRLIEIKCPVTRQPDGKVPKDYYHQMQMQLHVTGLTQCDFVEAVFHSPYSSPLKKDGQGLLFGQIALIYTVDKQGLDQNGRYEYGSVTTEPQSFEPVLKENERIAEMIPWKLLEWHEQQVVRSEPWWQTAIVAMASFWDDVAKAKVDPSFLNEHVKKKTEPDVCLIRL
uniref:YqaJ viral recombinase domain-containing protein n=1 Tax=viral metagenome TaxID=1070528 RepID=A0A6C0K2P0_9ZZZZ